MSNDIIKILSDLDSVHFATDTGSAMHARLARVTIDNDNDTGDPELVSKIKSIPELKNIFSKHSRCEVPIAGFINNHFISRRLDRLYIDDDKKTVYILDYKTDITHDTNHEKYVVQLKEYSALLKQIHPDYKIIPMILWTHDWTLEQI